MKKSPESLVCLNVDYESGLEWDLRSAFYLLDDASAAGSQTVL